MAKQTSSKFHSVLRTARWPLGLIVVICGMALGVSATYLRTQFLAGGNAEADTDAVTACAQLTSTFADYPLLYAGPEVLELPLTGCRHTKTDDQFAPDGTRYHVGSDFFTFVYGTCTIPAGSSSCPIPAAVIVDPVCAAPIDVGAVTANSSVRDAPALVKNDGSLRIETSSYKITIYGSGSTPSERTANATRVADSLVPANSLASALTPGAPLSTELAPAPVCQ